MEGRSDTEGSEAELHQGLDRLRDKVYAHTDKEGGRAVVFETIEKNAQGEAKKVQWYERWNSFEASELPSVIRLCEAQRRRMQLEFTGIQTELGHPEPEWT